MATPEVKENSPTAEASKGRFYYVVVFFIYVIHFLSARRWCNGLIKEHEDLKLRQEVSALRAKVEGARLDLAHATEQAAQHDRRINEATRKIIKNKDKAAWTERNSTLIDLRLALVDAHAARFGIKGLTALILGAHTDATALEAGLNFRRHELSDLGRVRVDKLGAAFADAQSDMDKAGVNADEFEALEIEASHLEELANRIVAEKDALDKETAVTDELLAMAHDIVKKTARKKEHRKPPEATPLPDPKEGTAARAIEEDSE